jgi:hypothetical protein
LKLFLCKLILKITIEDSTTRCNQFVVVWWESNERVKSRIRQQKNTHTHTPFGVHPTSNKISTRNTLNEGII